MRNRTGLEQYHDTVLSECTFSFISKAHDSLSSFPLRHCFLKDFSIASVDWVNEGQGIRIHDIGLLQLQSITPVNAMVMFLADVLLSSLIYTHIHVFHFSELAFNLSDIHDRARCFNL